MKPMIVTPFNPKVISGLRKTVRCFRSAFDQPGSMYHDPVFRRWSWHNLPVLKALHHSPEMRNLADKIFKRAVKPSYAFLSMYGKDGVCPLHTDREQCEFTIDLQIESDGSWPIYIDGKPFVLKDGSAICYSGTKQPHYREPMQKSRQCTFMNLAFFHFVPAEFTGTLD